MNRSHPVGPILFMGAKKNGPYRKTNAAIAARIQPDSVSCMFQGGHRLALDKLS